MIKKIKLEIVASIKNKKINVFFLFLLFAFIILIFTKLSKEHTNTLAFEIEKLNVPEENVILNDSVSLSITLKTHGFRWLKYYTSNAKIKIDFSKDVYKKDNVFIWHKSKSFLNNTQFDKHVELLNIVPDTLLFRYDVNLVKKVPVRLNGAIKYSPGYSTSKAVVFEPDSIEIIGANDVVSKIQYIETEAIVLEDIRTDLLETIMLELPKNNSDLKFSNNSVVLKARVERFTEGMLKIPVQVINVPEDIVLKFFPKEVSVSYYVSLSNFKTITIQDFKVICDYSKTTNNQSFLVPELVTSPKTIKNTKLNHQRIEFIITK